MLLKRYLPAALLLVAIVGLCTAAAFDPRGWRRSLKLGDEVHSLEIKNAEMARRESATLARSPGPSRPTPRRWKRAVRDELGFIHPGEMVLQLRPP